MRRFRLTQRKLNSDGRIRAALQDASRFRLLAVVHGDLCELSDDRTWSAVKRPFNYLLIAHLDSEALLTAVCEHHRVNDA